LDDSIATPLASLSAVLVEPFIQHHKTKDIRLLAACCIAELFRIFYPDPPYGEDQLKVVFSLFVSQLQGLEKPGALSFRSSFHLLECLATTKAFNLCLSLDSQDLLADLFKMMFAIVNDEQSSKVKMYMMDVMSSIIQEGESLSQEILDAILVNLVEPTKTNSAAVYNFAVDFVRKASQYLEPYIQLFFNNALVVGRSAESEVTDHLYDLILELHAIDSSILLSVMPQLEFKLKSTDTEERLEVTRLLARMFSPRDSRLATENKPLWLCFLGRFNDVSPSVRMECIRYSKYFLVYHAHLAGEVAQHLHERFHDREEKVRMESVKVVSEAAADNPKTVPQALMNDLQERMRDKIWGIRKEAMTNLARLYRQIMSSSTSSEAGISHLDADRMAWIPNKVLHSYYQNSSEDRLCVERCLLSCLIPVTLPVEDRMQRTSHVYCRLDDHASRAFEQLLRNREQLRSHLSDLIGIHQDKEITEGKRKEMMMSKIIQLARHLPDPVRCQSHLRELMTMMDDERLRQALLDALQLQSTCQDVMKAKGEALSKIGSKHGIVDTVKTLLDRCCPMLIDSKCVCVLVDQCVGQLCEPSISQTASEEKEENSRAKKTVHLVRVLAEICPSQFTTSDVFENLISLLRHKDSEIVEDTLQILTHTGANIDQTIAGCLQPIVTKLAQSGPPQLAKHTIRCIAAVFPDPTPILRRVFKSLMSALDYDNPHLLTALSSMEEIAESYTEIFQTCHKKVIKDFVVKKLLVEDRAQLEYREGDPEWCSDEQVSFETQAKVLGIRLLVSWLVGLESEFEHFASPVLRLLDMVLAHDGDLQGDDNISAHDRSRLRLAASCGLLKLAQCSHYHDLISQPQFQRLALSIQDTCDEVRDGFVTCLHQGLRSLKLPLAYLSIFALSGVEPRRDARTKLRQALANNVERRRECVKQHSKAKQNLQAILPEYSVSHAIYLISHHPQFSRTKPLSLDTFKDCLWFFLEPLVRGSDNYGFLRKLLETIKQTVDAQEPDAPEASKNIYAVCDLTLGVLTTKLTNIKIGDFPGKVLLPSKLFKPRAKDAPPNTACYLPPDYNCTPTKKLKVDDNFSASVSGEVEATPKKGRKAGGRASRTPSKTPTKASKTPTKAGKTPTKASKTPTKASKTPTKASKTPTKASKTLTKANQSQQNTDQS
jgi:sister-chromatid-cohesion protein PDS5